MCLLADKLFLGMPSRGDVIITAMTAKSETSSVQTSIQPGDLLTITGENTSTPVVEKLTNSSTADSLYGVATVGISGFTVPVITRGHVIVNTTDFDAVKKKVIAKCQGIQVAKIKARDPKGNEVEAYEVKL